MSEEETTTFESLNVWQESRKLRMEITLLVKEFPDEEKYRLMDQMIRAARSISGNIAEGHGRFHFQENIQFCRRARGSISELLDHMYTALDDKYITQDEFNYFREKCLSLEKIVNDYINYLSKQKQAHTSSQRSQQTPQTQVPQAAQPTQAVRTTHTSQPSSHKSHPPHPNKSPGGKRDGAKRL